MLPLEEQEHPLTGLNKDELKKSVHKSAKAGRAVRVVELLCNISKPIVNEVLEHVTEENEQKTTPLVIAAMSGKADVIEVLITNFGVNIEQKSTVKFDGYVIQDSTALWCAAGAGHIDVVKMLVKNGADVNNPTASNSTPLRAACFDGRLDIVKYLLENGADLTIPNKYDNTCLMISSYKGHSEVARYLLEKGANPDVKAHCGATSIHFAADCGHLSVVDVLVKFKASMITNGDGMTPIMIAADCGRESIVTYLMEHANCSILEQIHAIELLGASFANDKDLYNLSKAYHYLESAMFMKIGYYHMQKDQPFPQIPPVKAYGYRQECQSMAELEKMGDDANALHMEALTIRERILGPDNPEIPHPVIFRGAVFADSGQFDQCISLWMHALELRQSNTRSIAKDLLRLAQVFSQMLTLKAELRFDDVERVLNHGIKELIIHQKFIVTVDEPSSHDAKVSATELYHNNILSVIYLIMIASLVKSEEETHRFRSLVYSFLKCKCEYKNGYSPLHIIMDPAICVNDFHVNSLVCFPSQPLVSLFLACGADIDALDSSGNSALHIITRSHMPNITMERVRHDIVVELLQNGAHCDIANNQRQTPFLLARGTTLSFLSNHSNMTLRCLAARCIQENKIAYDFDIPLSLKSFVKLH